MLFMFPYAVYLYFKITFAGVILCFYRKGVSLPVRRLANNLISTSTCLEKIGIIYTTSGSRIRLQHSQNGSQERHGSFYVTDVMTHHFVLALTHYHR